MHTHLRTTLALTATGILTTGVLAAGLAAVPAYADTTHPAAPGQQHLPDLSATQLAQVRARQQAMLAQPAPAHTLTRAAARAHTKVQRITVTTTNDTDLATPTSTRCLDTTGACSLRAAVEAANNRATPVKIVLGPHTYTLTTGTSLTVTNPAGTSIVGTAATKTTISGNHTTRVIEEDQAASGGQAPLLYVTNLTVTAGTAADGAAFDLPGGETGQTLVLDGIDVTDNTATYSGGALYAAGYDTVYARHSSFSGNVAPEGGALSTNSSNINLDDVDLTDNSTAPGRMGLGGAWWSSSSVIRMRGGSISDNSVGSTNQLAGGGGLYDSAGNVALTDVHLDHNHAIGLGSGGAISAYFDLVQVTGGTISHNRADSSLAVGGGINVESGDVALHGVTMRGDRVGLGAKPGVGGGAIYLLGANFASQLTIDRGSKILGADGGAVYGYAISNGFDIEIDHSHLAGDTDQTDNGAGGRGCGGAVCAVADLTSSANVTMDQDRVDNNTSAGDQGSGAVSVWVSAFSSSRVHLVRSAFQNNTAGGGGYGGAVGLSGPPSSTPTWLHTDSDTFSRNTAGIATDAGNGGAISINDYATYGDQGSVFSRNRARGDGASGGAVYDNGRQSSSFSRSTFVRNAAGPSTGGGGQGGAVFTDDQGGTAFSQVSMTGNRAASYGGGIDTSADEVAVTVERSTIAGNVAGNPTSSGYGGGIYSLYATLLVENSTLTDNRATQGGAINDNDGNALGLRYSTVSANVADQGAGIFSGSSGASLLGSIVSANHRTNGAEQDCATSTSETSAHSLGGNVLGQSGCVTATMPTDIVSRHPRLGTLHRNGGPTATMALTGSGPAIALATHLCPTTDQRGLARPATHCDAGAFELPKARHHH